MSNPANREDILEYLFSLLEGISGVATVWRNRGDLPQADPQTGVAQCPALILLDGDLRIMQRSADIYIRKGVKMRSAIAIMSPQIRIVLQKSDTLSNNSLDGQAYNPGMELSNWDFLIRSAIENEPGLISLLTTTGGMIYQGFQTNMKLNSDIGALAPQGAVLYDFYYPFITNFGA